MMRWRSAPRSHDARAVEEAIEMLRPSGAAEMSAGFNQRLPEWTRRRGERRWSG